MAETADFDPGPWKGHDFVSARASYDVHVGRSYGDAASKGVDGLSLVPEEITTESTCPLVIASDVTGSMGEFPGVMFSKLPYLELEAKEYLGDDLEICFAAVGDVFSDKYPLQVRPFAKGTDLKVKLEELVIEGGGGSQYRESYDVAAMYFARNCKMPNAIKPLMIFIGDEGLYDDFDKELGEKWARTGIEGRLRVEEVIHELKSKFTVYLVRKPYGSVVRNRNEMSDLDLKIQMQWERLLGEDHVCLLPEANRIVDVIFGILAKETGRIEYFTKELTERQLKDKDGKHKIDIVLKSLHTAHSMSLKKLPKPDVGKSITRRSRRVTTTDD